MKNFEFIIIAPNGNYASIRTTVFSIRGSYPNSSVSCIVGNNLTQEKIDEIAKICPVSSTNTSIPSLLNSALEHIKNDWVIILTEGVIVGRGMARKMLMFANSETDILYPIVPEYDRQGRPVYLNDEFPESTLNGLTIHKSVLHKVGKLSENPIKISKTYWQWGAVELGYRFKGVLGVKII